MIEINGALIATLQLRGYLITNHISRQGGDVSILTWAAVYADIAGFDAIAPYIPKADGILVHIDRKFTNESQTERKKSISLTHSYYHFMGNVLPQSTELKVKLNQLMIKVLGPHGLDKIDCTDMSTPEGIGNFVGKRVAHLANNNGMNSKGDIGGRKYNLKHFADYTGYAPVNTLNKIIDPTKWQPHIGYGSDGIQIFSQAFITPQLGNVKPFSVSTVNNITVKDPARHLPEKYQIATDEVIDAVSNLTDFQKVMAEYSNNKRLITTSINAYAVTKLNYNQDRLMFFITKTAIASYDAMIAVWKEKARYNAARPFTAIRHLYKNRTLKGYSHESHKTVDDMPAMDWESYIPTANHPEYPSATAAFCSANAEVMRLETGSDNTHGFEWKITKGSSFVEKGQPEDDVILNFDTWTEWEYYCGFSRLWGGMHFKDSVTEAMKLGKILGKTSVNFVNKKLV